ncbi:unnamed protein product [Amoebophrya sp. A120]|nr:unnamed protein product [Amoebophrya sp. A120]|eukprot:GSA120T00002713001.1
MLSQLAKFHHPESELFVGKLEWSEENQDYVPRRLMAAHDHESELRDDYLRNRVRHTSDVDEVDRQVRRLVGRYDSLEHLDLVEAAVDPGSEEGKAGLALIGKAPDKNAPARPLSGAKRVLLHEDWVDAREAADEQAASSSKSRHLLEEVHRESDQILRELLSDDAVQHVIFGGVSDDVNRRLALATPSSGAVGGNQQPQHDDFDVEEFVEFEFRRQTKDANGNRARPLLGNWEEIEQFMQLGRQYNFARARNSLHRFVRTLLEHTILLHEGEVDDVVSGPHDVVEQPAVVPNYRATSVVQELPQTAELSSTHHISRRGKYWTFASRSFDALDAAAEVSFGFESERRRQLEELSEEEAEALVAAETGGTAAKDGPPITLSITVGLVTMEPSKLQQFFGATPDEVASALLTAFGGTDTNARRRLAVDPASVNLGVTEVGFQDPSMTTGLLNATLYPIPVLAQPGGTDAPVVDLPTATTTTTSTSTSTSSTTTVTSTTTTTTTSSTTSTTTTTTTTVALVEVEVEVVEVTVSVPTAVPLVVTPEQEVAMASSPSVQAGLEDACLEKYASASSDVTACEVSDIAFQDARVLIAEDEEEPQHVAVLSYPVVQGGHHLQSPAPARMLKVEAAGLGAENVFGIDEIRGNIARLKNVEPTEDTPRLLQLWERRLSAYEKASAESRKHHRRFPLLTATDAKILTHLHRAQAEDAARKGRSLGYGTSSEHALKVAEWATSTSQLAHDSTTRRRTQAVSKVMTSNSNLILQSSSATAANSVTSAVTAAATNADPAALSAFTAAVKSSIAQKVAQAAAAGTPDPVTALPASQQLSSANINNMVQPITPNLLPNPATISASAPVTKTVTKEVAVTDTTTTDAPTNFFSSMTEEDATLITVVIVLLSLVGVGAGFAYYHQLQHRKELKGDMQHLKNVHVELAESHKELHKRHSELHEVHLDLQKSHKELCESHKELHEKHNDLHDKHDELLMLSIRNSGGLPGGPEDVDHVPEGSKNKVLAIEDVNVAGGGLDVADRPAGSLAEPPTGEDRTRPIEKPGRHSVELAHPAKLASLKNAVVPDPAEKSKDVAQPHTPRRQEAAAHVGKTKGLMTHGSKPMKDFESDVVKEVVEEGNNPNASRATIAPDEVADPAASRATIAPDEIKPAAPKATEKRASLEKAAVAAVPPIAMDNVARAPMEKPAELKGPISPRDNSPMLKATTAQGSDISSHSPAMKQVEKPPSKPAERPPAKAAQNPPAVVPLEQAKATPSRPHSPRHVSPRHAPPYSGIQGRA